MSHNSNTTSLLRFFLLVIVPQHILAISSIVYLYYTASYYWLLLTFVSWLLFYVIGEGIFLHRYFAHKTFECHPLVAKFFSIMALMGGFGSPMGFASIHIIHHAFSDTDKDFHTPTKGFFHAYLGWYLSTIKISSPVLMATRHLLKDKFYPRLEKYKISIWWGLAIILALIDFRILIFSMGLAGFIGWHFTCITNSAAHRIGSQRYDNGDHSTNIWWLSWIFWQGSGALQNNHHHAPGRFHDSERWYEFDIAKYLIPLLATKIHDRSRP